MSGARRIGVLLVGITLVLSLAGPAAGATTAAPTVPDTPVGRQVGWLLDISHRLPINAKEAKVHFAPSFLRQVPVPKLNQILSRLAGDGGFTLLLYHARGAHAATSASGILRGAGGKRLRFAAGVDAGGKIAALVFTPYTAPPASWAGLDRRLHALAPRVSLLAAQVRNGRCVPVHEVAAHTARPLGSAFKLYVLGALAHAVHSGSAAWHEKLAIHQDWKSLPSGVLQNKPAGTELSLRTYADYMISISDNTAADHLIHRLGRRTVQHQLRRFGNQHTAKTVPFPTTRELFQLKLRHYPLLARAYQHLPRVARRPFLNYAIDPLPLPGTKAVQAWRQPRAIDSIEWFASPSDICRAFTGLARQNSRPELRPVGQALSRNDGGILLGKPGWPTLWFKGGSEPGVLTLNYLARTPDGRTFVVSAMLSNTRNADPIDTAPLKLLPLIRGAFQLAASHTS